MSDLRALCARIPGNELVAAECANLTGGWPDGDGVAICQSVDLIPRAAYVTAGLRCLAQAPTLEALAQAVAAQPIPAEDFQLGFVYLSGTPPESKTRAIRTVADALNAYPNLDAPSHRFLIVAQASGLWLGEILSETRASFRLHDAKPYRTSSSLSSRLSRGLVNLVCPPASSLLDPFCGTGSILLEAAAIGVPAWGADHNPKMVHMSCRNLAHFGLPPHVERLDARETSRSADVIVTDLPYGRSLEQDLPGLLPIFRRLTSLAPRAVYLAEQDISAWLEEAGYGSIQVLKVRKRPELSRYIHIAHSAGI